MRPIDADALKERLKKPIWMDKEKSDRLWDGWHECTVAVDAAIDSMQTIEPERKTGKWLDENGKPAPWEEGYGGWYPAGSVFCSECKEWLVASDEYPVYGNYCPVCGCRMERADGKTNDIRG